MRWFGSGAEGQLRVAEDGGAGVEHRDEFGRENVKWWVHYKCMATNGTVPSVVKGWGWVGPRRHFNQIDGGTCVVCG